MSMRGTKISEVKAGSQPAISRIKKGDVQHWLGPKGLPAYDKWLKQTKAPIAKLRLLTTSVSEMSDNWADWSQLYQPTALFSFLDHAIEVFSQVLSISSSAKISQVEETIRLVNIFLPQVEKLLRPFRDKIADPAMDGSIDKLLHGIEQLLVTLHPGDRSRRCLQLNQVNSLLNLLYAQKLLSTSTLANSLNAIAFFAESRLLSGKPVNINWLATPLKSDERLSPAMAAQYLTGLAALAKYHHLQEEVTLPILHKLMQGLSRATDVNTIALGANALLKLLDNSPLIDVNSWSIEPLLEKLLNQISKQPNVDLEIKSPFSHPAVNKHAFTSTIILLSQIIKWLNTAAIQPKKVKLSSLQGVLRSISSAEKNADWPKHAAKTLLSVGQIVQAGRYKDQERNQLQPFVDAIATELNLRIVDLELEDMAQAAYALILLGHNSQLPLLQEALQKILIKTPPSKETFSYAQQALEYFYHAGMTSIKPPPWIIPHIEPRRPRLKPKSSHVKIFNALQEYLKVTELDNRYQCEAEELLGAWFVDICITDKETGKKYVIELDGESHWLHGVMLRPQDERRDLRLKKLLDENGIAIIAEVTRIPALYKINPAEIAKDIVTGVQKLAIVPADAKVEPTIDQPAESEAIVPIVVEAALPISESAAVKVADTVSEMSESSSAADKTKRKISFQKSPPASRNSKNARRKKAREKAKMMRSKVEQSSNLPEKNEIKAQQVLNSHSQCECYQCRPCKDPNDAYIQQLTRLAKSDQAHAQYMLAIAYLDKDKQQFIDWLTRAAELGHPLAQNYLGYCYHCGDGVNHDGKKAFDLYSSAAAGGLKIAQYNLYLCYLMGVGTKADFAKALAALKLAAQEPDAIKHAQRKLAEHYEDEDKLQNGPEIFRLYFSAAQDSEPAQVARAQYGLARCYEYGMGVPINIKTAVEFYTAAAQGEHRGAQYTLGILYMRGVGDDPPDEQQAFQWFQQASQQPNPLKKAQYHLGQCYEFGIGVPINIKTAVEFYTAAAQGEHRGAQYTLGILYMKGIGDGPPDKKQAFQWFQRAAQEPNPLKQAQYHLGQCYEFGVGVDKNEEEAIKYYALAAQAPNGLKQAQDAVSELAYKTGKAAESASIDLAIKWYSMAAPYSKEAAQAVARLQQASLPKDIKKRAPGPGSTLLCRSPVIDFSTVDHSSPKEQKPPNPPSASSSIAAIPRSDSPVHQGSKAKSKSVESEAAPARKTNDPSPS